MISLRPLDQREFNFKSLKDKFESLRPAGVGGVQRSATHADMPHLGSIHERKAALEASSVNGWRARVCRFSPEKEDSKAIERAKNRINDRGMVNLAAARKWAGSTIISHSHRIESIFLPKRSLTGWGLLRSCGFPWAAATTYNSGGSHAHLSSDKAINKMCWSNRY
ncbi:hypothetical protein EVAR_10153_1 [Eumeta japonica]|uniref:Uncharacterized protein n=1 Tax=Eumeta variegata TaxID=151549 RepID=A0A4C1UDK7_EUMVA|nr:hypothetical protein EVAR_10153_1 [Eumeta japonica]